MSAGMTDERRERRDRSSKRTRTGTFRIHEGFRSEHLEHERSIIVYLPPGYRPSAARRYPVLYLQDGQNLFDPATSATGSAWRVDETARDLIAAGEVEPLIVVGVYNAGEHRIDEYAPTRREEIGGGRADHYGRMLVEELKPFIDRTYKTLPGAANTGLGGSSLGGLLAMHLGLRNPTAFGRLAIMSPSVWWDDRVIVREVEALTHRLPFRVWLDAGTDEGPEVVADARLLRDALLARGWQAGEDLAYLEAEGGRHDESSWAARVGPMLRFLFPKA